MSGLYILHIYIYIHIPTIVIKASDNNKQCVKRQVRRWEGGKRGESEGGQEEEGATGGISRDAIVSVGLAAPGSGAQSIIRTG